MERGLLSNHRAKALKPVSLAMTEVQDLRARKRVPGGLRLHEYVNLYVCARNPMLYKRLGHRHDACVLSVSPDVLDIDGVVVTDQNAASKYVRYGSGSSGLAIVDRDLTFAEYWTDDDPVTQFRRSSAKCAEVLVPNRIQSTFIQAAYVCSSVPRGKIEALGLRIKVIENSPLFFNCR